MDEKIDTDLQSLEVRLSELNDRVSAIESRNRRVESDKTWETSFTRRIFVTLVTYLTTAIVFYLIGVTHFLSNALIPTTGYYLSTLSLPFVRRIWARRR